MSNPTAVAIDFEAILDVVAEAPGRPGVDDYGVPYAAAARAALSMLDADVYGSAFLKAAALLDTLLRHPWLERNQARVSWVATTALLDANGYQIRGDVEPEGIAAILAQVIGLGIPLTELSQMIQALCEPIGGDQ